MKVKQKNKVLPPVRIEESKLNDFQSTLEKNTENMSEVIRSWIDEYNRQEKWRYYEIRNKRLYALVRAFNERVAVSKVNDLLAKQDAPSTVYERELTVNDCRLVSRDYALIKFTQNVAEKHHLKMTSDVEADFLEANTMLVMEENLYYFTNKEVKLVSLFQHEN